MNERNTKLEHKQYLFKGIQSLAEGSYINKLEEIKNSNYKESMKQRFIDIDEFKRERPDRDAFPKTNKTVFH